ncbi:Extracellular dioxygenase [Aspergillus sp. HF37]|nr:Extracellular dioxygenase [Aspergillus sp. HF37]
MHLPTIITGLLAGLASIAAAHPGHDVHEEAAERAAFLKRAPPHARSLSHCSPSLTARGLEKANVVRRDHTVRKLREARGWQQHAPLLKARDGLNTSHHSSMDVNLSTDPSVIFRSDGTCILGPDTTQGPYYVTGELIRSDITDGQPGVPLYLDMQMINTKTCEPVPDIYMDFWHCNSTGVYSGVTASGNGNAADESNLDKTFLRGLQKTDRTGVAQIQTIFPGHYRGRATHIHVIAHSINNTETNANNTLTGLYTAHAGHVGQLFFDQSLISAVEKNAPYSTNTQPLTQNADDRILQNEAATIDPFVEYVFLGEEAADGIFAWISMGMDVSQDETVEPAAYYTENGGVENEDAQGGPMGSAPPMGSGSAPPRSSPTSSRSTVPSSSPAPSSSGCSPS